MSKGQLRERLPQLLRRKATAPTDSTFGRLRQIRNDKGNAALIGVLIALAITGIMLSIAGPDMLALISDTRGAKLEQNFVAATTIVENRLRSDPDILSDGYDANFAPTDALLDDLFRDGSDFTWLGEWDLPTAASDNSDTTIRLQFINKDGTDAIPTSGSPDTPPAVPWLLDDGTALRMHAANEDGRWICALMVVRTDVAATNGSVVLAPTTGAAYQVVDSSSNRQSTIVPALRKAVVDAVISKTWYNSGDSYSSDGAGQLHHCSPVGQVAAAGAVQAISYLPMSGEEWNILRDVNSDASTAPAASTLTSDP